MSQEYHIKKGVNDMLEEKLRLLQSLLSQDSVNNLELKKVLFPLTSSEKTSILSQLSAAEYKKFIEITFSVDYKFFAKVSTVCDKEYDKFVQTPDFFDQLVASHYPLSEEEIQENISLVEKERQKLVESPDYGFLLYDSLSQLINFKASNTTVLDYLGRLDLNLEFMTLYLDFMTIYEDSFIDRDPDKIKKSIKDSIYCSRSALLLENSIENLEKNNPDSFLVLPIIQAPSKEGAHNSAVIVRKTGDSLEVTMLDKAMHYSQELHQSVPKVSVKEQTSAGFMSYLKNMLEGENNPNIKAAIPHVFELDSSKENITKLSYVLGFGMTPVGQTIQLSLATRENKCFLIEKELKQMAAKSYWGRAVFDVQLYTNNCYIKSVSAAMQYVLGDRQTSELHLVNAKPAELRKIPQHSAKTLAVSLAEIIKHRMRKLGYTEECVQAIETLVEDYLAKKDQNYASKRKYAETKKMIEKHSKIDLSVFERSAQPKVNVSLTATKYSSKYFNQSLRTGSATPSQSPKPFQLCDLEEVATVRAAIQETLTKNRERGTARKSLSELATVTSEGASAKEQSEKQSKKQLKKETLEL